MQTSPQQTCHGHKCMVLSPLKLEGFPHVSPKGWDVEHAFSPLISQRYESFKSPFYGMSLAQHACTQQRVVCKPATSMQ